MAEKKDDAARASHYLTTHAVGPFSAGQTVSAEQVKKTFGRDRDAPADQHEAYLADGLKRLLDLGAIVPTEAPPTPEEEAEKAKKAEAEAEKERKAAEEEEAAKKQPPHKR